MQELPDAVRRYLRVGGLGRFGYHPVDGAQGRCVGGGDIGMRGDGRGRPGKAGIERVGRGLGLGLVHSSSLKTKTLSLLS